MALLLLMSSLAFPFGKVRVQPGCEQRLKQQRFFSEFSIAKAIEQLGKPEGEIFAYVLHGSDERVVAEKFGTTPMRVREISLKGMEYVWIYKRKGL